MTSRFLDVLNQMVAKVINSLNAAGITTPTQIGVGEPNVEDLVTILKAGGYQVSLFDRRGTMRSTARYPTATLFPIGNPTSTLVATVMPPGAFGTPWTIALTGSVGVGAFIAAIVGSPTQAATHQCAANEQLATVATALAAAIDALAVHGTTATAVGNNVLVAGSPECLVNVSGTGYVLAQEVNRFARSVQLAIWAPDPELRFVVADAIASSVGTIAAPFVTLSDGTQALVTLDGGATSGEDDANESEYSLYVEYLIFAVEYGVLETYQSFPIQSVDATLTVSTTLTVGSIPPEVITSP